MKKLTLALLSLIPLTACAVDTDLDTQTANHVARPAFMVERTIQAGQFNLNAWERMHERFAPATIYIEGDGTSFKPEPTNTATGAAKNVAAATDNVFGENPTPKTPVALHLASRDNSKNLAYISRPCQYVKNPEEKGCNAAYWNTRKYSPEVLMAYDSALNEIAARYNITEFNIVGFGGGANIAAVLAATRDDIKTLRTVAGNLSPTFVSNYHQSAALSSDAMLATNYGSKLATIPQHHFIGAADTVIPPGTYHSYRQALGLSDCINYSVLQDAGHHLGWTQTWPQLLALQPECAVLHNSPDLPPAGEFPGNYYKGMRKGAGFSK